MSLSLHNSANYNHRASIDCESSDPHRMKLKNQSLFSSKSRNCIYGRAPGTSILFQDKLVKNPRSSFFDTNYNPISQPKSITNLRDSLVGNTCSSLLPVQSQDGFNFGPKQKDSAGKKIHHCEHQIKRMRAAEKRQKQYRAKKIEFQAITKRYDNKIQSVKKMHKEIQQKEVIKERKLLSNIFDRREKVQQLRKSYSAKIQQQLHMRFVQSRRKLQQINGTIHLSPPELTSHKIKPKSHPPDFSLEDMMKFDEIINFGLKSYILPSLSKKKNMESKRENEDFILKKQSQIPNHSEIVKDLKALYRIKNLKSLDDKNQQNTQTNSIYSKILTLDIERQVKDPEKLLQYLKQGFKLCENEADFTKLLQQSKI